MGDRPTRWTDESPGAGRKATGVTRGWALLAALTVCAVPAADAFAQGIAGGAIRTSNNQPRTQRPATQPTAASQPTAPKSEVQKKIEEMMRAEGRPIPDEVRNMSRPMTKTVHPINTTPQQPKPKSQNAFSRFFGGKKSESRSTPARPVSSAATKPKRRGVLNKLFRREKPVLIPTQQSDAAPEPTTTPVQFERRTEPTPAPRAPVARPLPAPATAPAVRIAPRRGGIAGGSGQALPITRTAVTPVRRSAPSNPAVVTMQPGGQSPLSMGAAVKRYRVLGAITQPATRPRTIPVRTASVTTRIADENAAGGLTHGAALKRTPEPIAVTPKPPREVPVRTAALPRPVEPKPEPESHPNRSALVAGAGLFGTPQPIRSTETNDQPIEPEVTTEPDSKRKLVTTLPIGRPASEPPVESTEPETADTESTEPEESVSEPIADNAGETEIAETKPADEPTTEPKPANSIEAITEMEFFDEGEPELEPVPTADPKLIEPETAVADTSDASDSEPVDTEEPTATEPVDEEDDDPFTGLVLDSEPAAEPKPETAPEPSTESEPIANDSESVVAESQPAENVGADAETEPEPTAPVVAETEPTVTEPMKTAVNTEPESEAVTKPEPKSESVAATKPKPKAPESKAKAKTHAERIASRKGMTGFKGFCPVTLREERDLVDTNVQYASVFNEKTYFFSSKEALSKFEDRPDLYAPVGRGRDVTITDRFVPGSLDHAAWYRDRLYLFSSRKSLAKFVSNPNRYAAEFTEPVIDQGGIGAEFESEAPAESERESATVETPTAPEEEFVEETESDPASEPEPSEELTIEAAESEEPTESVTESEATPEWAEEPAPIKTEEPAEPLEPADTSAVSSEPVAEEAPVLTEKTAEEILAEDTALFSGEPAAESDDAAIESEVAPVDDFDPFAPELK